MFTVISKKTGEIVFFTDDKLKIELFLEIEDMNLFLIKLNGFKISK